MSKKINGFHFITPVWGVNHINAFLEVGLPSLLAPSNLPGISNLHQSCYQLFTRQADMPVFEASPAYHHLCEIITVDVHFIDEKIETPHLMMSQCHRKGIGRANDSGAGAVFIPPDCVWAEGSMVNLERIVARGVPIVHMSGLRLVLETALPEMVREWRSEDRCVLRIEPRDLVSLGMKCLHPITKDLFFREQSEKLMPANLLWMVGGEGVYARCFHLHPLFVEPNERNAAFTTTIDDDLAVVSDPEGKKDYVVSDSDEILAFELSHISHKVGASYEKGSVADVAAWAEVGMNLRHRQLVQAPIRIHSTDISREKWQQIEEEANRVVSEALKLVDKSSWYLLLFNRRNLSHRFLAAEMRNQSSLDNERKQRTSPGKGSIVSNKFNLQSLPQYLRYLCFLGYKRIHHFYNAVRYRCIALPYYLIRSVGPIVSKVNSGFFGVSPNIRPWHWRWCFERDVLRPILASVNEEVEGSVLCIEHEAVLFDERLLCGSKAHKVVTTKKLSMFSAAVPSNHVAQESSEQFDVGVCVSLPSINNISAISKIGGLIRPGGRFLISGGVGDQGVCDNVLNSLEQDFKVRSHRHLGSFGTTMIARLFKRIYRMPVVVKSKGMHLTLLRLPVIVSVGLLKVVVYPIISLLAIMLNLLGTSKAIPGECFLVLEKQGLILPEKA